MSETRLERIERFAMMHSSARIKAGRSQDFMAAELCVSKKTIQNWEKGISSPSFFQSLEWFRVLKINPFPHYLSYVYPKQLKNVRHDSDDKKIEEAFDVLMGNISVNTKRALLYLFYGEHGSSPNAVIQMILAHLHTPMKDRIAPASIIAQMYEMEKELGNLVCTNNIQPDMNVLKKAISCGISSAVNNEKGYNDIEKEMDVDNVHLVSTLMKK